MRLNYLYYILLALFMGCYCAACKGTYRSGDSLSQTEQQYIQSLGLLTKGERIYLFDSQGGFSGVEVSGNFFTNKRMASYWIDKDRPQKTSIHSAYYPEIISITKADLSKSLTYSSYLEVQKADGQKFRVFVSADSVGTQTFFNQARAQWQAVKSLPH